MNQERMIHQKGVTFKSRVHAILSGYRLIFNKSSGKPGQGFANIVATDEGLVEGVLYEIGGVDLEKLDQKEGYPDHYNRFLLSVTPEVGESEKAWVYVAQPSKVQAGLKPTKEYLGHLIAGCDLLSQTYCKKLRVIPTLD